MGCIVPVQSYGDNNLHKIMNLHRWYPFKPDFQVDTLTTQANVDHCGACGLTPVAASKPFKPLKKPPSTKMPKHFRKSAVGTLFIMSTLAATWLSGKIP